MKKKVDILSELVYVIATYVLLAECVALWGEPEQAVHGMKGKRETIWLVIAFELMTYVTEQV